MNKSIILLLIMTFSSLFGDANVVVRHGDQQVAQGEFIGTYMNHVHILMGDKIIYYACDDIVSITSSSEGFSYGNEFDYDCSKNTVTADILFPPVFDPMTGEMTQVLPDVFNPDIIKENDDDDAPATKDDAISVYQDEMHILSDVLEQGEPILSSQKSAIRSLAKAKGFSSQSLDTYLMKNYSKSLDGLSHTDGADAIKVFQSSDEKPLTRYEVRQIVRNEIAYQKALGNIGSSKNQNPSSNLEWKGLIPIILKLDYLKIAAGSCTLLFLMMLMI